MPWALPDNNYCEWLALVFVAMDFNIQTGNGFLIMTNGDLPELAERLREQLTRTCLTRKMSPIKQALRYL